MAFPFAGFRRRSRTLFVRWDGDPPAPNVLWKYTKGTAYVPSPILYGDYLYLTTDRGILTCIDAKTGQVKYEGGRVPIPFDVLRLASGVRRQDSDDEPGWRQFS